MSNESSAKCPQCGAALPPNAPAGLCPNCLMALNLQTETVFTDDSPTAHPPLPPEQLAPHFPQLEILECLGRGGMGVVYKARQKSLNRLVALKLLAPERVNESKFAERFAREAQALAALNHPNIVTIYDFGQAGGYFFLLMEFMDGVNLRQLLRSRKFTPEEALAIVPPLCDALQFAHERGIVHRDIKPENLLLDKSGRVKIADFGIAKMLGTDDGGSASNIGSPDNATQTALGTPGYSAPEQKTSPQRVDSRADIYSLGVVFYEMLTGELPAKRIEPPSKKVHIDVRLDAVVMRALEKTPELRWQTAAELRTQVETISQSEKSFSSPAPSGMKPQFSRKAILGAIWLPLLAFFASRSLGIPLSFSHSRTGPVNFEGNTLPMLFFLAIIGAIGTTGLGWQAIGDIRRSRGQIIGLPLAIADALLVPFILLDALIVFLCCLLAIAAQGSPDLSIRGRAMVVVSSVVLCLVADILVAWSVWRYATKPMADTGESPGKPPAPFAGKQPTGGQTAEDQARFSHTAIVGACWAPIFLLALVSMYWMAGPVAVSAGQPLPQRSESMVGLALGLPLALLGLTAPFGTTILGWIAAAQIRRSGGKLYGLGLAVFDGLLFPLALLDVVIFFVSLRAMEFHFHSHEFNQHPQFILFWMLTLAVICIVDFLIVRSVWRAVGQATGARGFWKFLAVSSLIVAVAGLGGFAISRKFAVQSSSVWIPARYRVFEADAALVDSLVPPETRARGDEREQGLIYGGTPPSAVSQMADVDAGVLSVMLSESSKNPGLLLDKRKEISLWPKMADGESYALANRVGGIGGFVGVRNENNHLEFRAQYNVTHLIAGENSVTAEIFYEGPAPATGHARMFFIPFAGKTNASRYLVVAFEVGPDAGEPASKRELTFGAVHELMLDNSGQASFIDLDRDRVFANFTGASRDIEYWKRTNGIDLSLAKLMTGAQGVDAFDMQMKQIAMDRWLTIAPKDVIADGDELATNVFLETGHTYEFLTREIGAGVLQVVGATGHSPGITIRYKMIQSPVIFGETIERVMALKGPDHRALKLATGEFVAPPGDWGAFQFTQEGTNRLRAAGVDLYASDASEGSIITALDLRKCSECNPDESDATGTPSPLLRVESYNGLFWWIVQNAEDSSDTGKNPDLAAFSYFAAADKARRLKPHEDSIRGTKVWEFRTRDGAEGVLQIVGYTGDANHPEGVRIRYKLVQK